MRRLEISAVAAALLLVLSACASESSEPETTSLPVAAVTIAEAASPTATGSTLCARVDGPSCVFDYDNFDNPTAIDNKWLPMTPGTQLVYEGTTNEDDELLEHQVIITVTDLTKVIDGIETVVSWDLDFSEGELVEAELAFFAQDNDGNVWRMGEHPEEYEDGEIVDAPTWLAGIEGAKAGISMLADPEEGTLSYSQGWAPAVEFIDRGRVQQVGQETCVEADCFTDVLVIAEFNVEEQGASQLKYFASGIGNVQVGWNGNDETQEELELVSVEQLDAAALVDVRAAALELEASAYEVSPDVYGRTEPAVDAGGPTEDGSSLCSSLDGPSCVFDYDNFDNPTAIDNKWLPMTPGTQLVYEGTTNEDDELLEHQVIITVTDLTKVIDGIETVVSWDLDFSEGELVEAELAFFAQDNDGNVWRMGEHPEEYEDGEIVDAPTWLAGIEGAKAGISMLADPEEGTLSYSQGWAPAVEFIDRGRVQQVGQETCVEADCFTDVLVIAEFNVEEQGASQLKYFASGIGNVQVGWNGNDETQEELELVSVEQLDAAALVDVRAAALELEASAYEVSPDVYGRTEPAASPR